MKMIIKRTGKILSATAAVLAAILLTALFVQFIVQLAISDKAFGYVGGGHFLPIKAPCGLADNISYGK